MLILGILILAYIVLNCVLYLIQKWLEKQLEYKPDGKTKLYVECEWYKNPTTTKYKIAKWLVNTGLPRYEEPEYVVYVTFGLIVFILLFVILGNAFSTPSVD